MHLVYPVIQNLKKILKKALVGSQYGKLRTFLEENLNKKIQQICLYDTN